MVFLVWKKQIKVLWYGSVKELSTSALRAVMSLG